MDITCTIDDREITVKKGSTILEAAEKAGIRIPAMCHMDGYPPFTSCMVCVVQDKTSGRLVPSCSARVTDGMVIETASDAVFKARQDALNMLLSEHAGECTAPCTRTCPAHPDLPRMIRCIGTGSDDSIFSAIRQAIPFPSITGHICPAPCEMVCRRGGIDAPLSIKLLEKYTGDVLAGKSFEDALHIPRETGKRAAVIGSGPAGLAAAYYLRLYGHACTLFEKDSELGGQIRQSITEVRLPHEVLERELSLLGKTGVIIRTGMTYDTDISLDELQAGYDVIVLALGKLTGNTSLRPVELCENDRIIIDRETFMTRIPGIFACGACVSPMTMAIRAMTHGRRAAYMADLFLKREPIIKPGKVFNSMVKKYTQPELLELLKNAAPDNRVMPLHGEPPGFMKDEAEKEAARCLHCDCHKAEGCLLRKYAQEYDADQQRYEQETRKQIRRIADHPSVIFEPAKCIKCGRCVRLTEGTGNGFCFTGRGYEVDIDVPFDSQLQMIEEEVLTLCVRSCPTGALAFK